MGLFLFFGQPGDRRERADDVDQDDGHREVTCVLVTLDQLVQVERPSPPNDQESHHQLRDDQK